MSDNHILRLRFEKFCNRLKKVDFSNIPTEDVADVWSHLKSLEEVMPKEERVLKVRRPRRQVHKQPVKTERVAYERVVGVCPDEGSIFCVAEVVDETIQ